MIELLDWSAEHWFFALVFVWLTGTVLIAACKALGPKPEVHHHHHHHSCTKDNDDQ